MNLTESVDISPWQARFNKKQEKKKVTTVVQSYKITTPTLRLYEGIRAGEKQPSNRD